MLMGSQDILYVHRVYIVQLSDVDDRPIIAWIVDGRNIIKGAINGIYRSDHCLHSTVQGRSTGHYVDLLTIHIEWTPWALCGPKVGS